MRLRQLFEAKTSEVAIIFGRFNPPHMGHKAAWELASKSPVWFVGTNQSTIGPKDPLPYDVKVKAMKAVWPEVESHIVAETGWLTLASKVYEQYPDATLLCLTDEDWVTKTIQQYNGKEGDHGFYNFTEIKQKPTPRLSSATALRDAVMKDDRDAFSKAAGVDADTLVDGKPFFDLVAEYLLPYAKLEKTVKNKSAKKKVPESDEMPINNRLSIQQLATISDEALDKVYGYGRSSPGNTFGWQANLKSAAYAKQMIDKGITDIEAISDAIHKGWNVTAKAFVTNPDQFDDTEKLKAAGKLDAKLQQREKLMNIPYAQLSDEEQEKDRVVARALLQAIKGKQGVAEGSDSGASATPAKNERGRFTALDDDEPIRLKCEDGEFRTIQEINMLRQKIGMKPFSIKSQQGVAEGSLEEYGDTAKGQKMLTKVQKRAVDRVVSKKAETDPKYAKKNADTANRAWDRFGEKEKYGEDMNERIRDPEDWDEGNTEPGNNFAIYINGKKWKVLPGPYGAYADSPEERREFARLQAMAQRKSQESGKKWEVSITGEPATR